MFHQVVPNSRAQCSLAYITNQVDETISGIRMLRHDSGLDAHKYIMLSIVGEVECNDSLRNRLEKDDSFVLPR